jgi:hypothetical protein
MQNYALSASLPKFWDILHPSVTNDMANARKMGSLGRMAVLFDECFGRRKKVIIFADSVKVAGFFE